MVLGHFGHQSCVLNITSPKMLLLTTVLGFFFLMESPSPLDKEKCSLLYVWYITESKRNSVPYWYPRSGSLTVLTFLTIEVCLIHLVLFFIFLFFLRFEDTTKLIKWYVVGQTYNQRHLLEYMDCNLEGMNVTSPYICMVDHQNYIPINENTNALLLASVYTCS